jgi:hypothetical protein
MDFKVRLKVYHLHFQNICYNVFNGINVGQINGIGIPFFHIHIGGILTPIRYLNLNRTIFKISLIKDAHVIQPSNQY